MVFILADDLGWRDLSNEGSTYYESPNLDRLARSGMKFTRAYATCQVCSPSRASIFTGQYPTNHGVTTWIGDRTGVAWRETGRHDSHLPPDYAKVLRAETTTLAEAFREAGYRTFFAGKWHLGSKGSWPEDHGFDVNKGGWDHGSPAGGYFSPWKNPKLVSGPVGEALPMRLARETAVFIEENQNAPFFAFLSFYSVHSPLETNGRLWKKYRDKALKASSPKQRFVFDRRLAVRQVQDCPIYAGMIESMDDAVGVVMAKLETLGLLDNTIVCFTSDNGGVSSGDAFATSNLPLRGGKGRQWEGGIRVPAYLVAPGVTDGGSTCDVPISGIDWYPTLLDLAKLQVNGDQDVDGASLVPLLGGRAIANRPLFWHYPHYGNQGGEPASIVIDEGWKLIHYHEDGRDEMYNLAADEGEQRDLAQRERTRARDLRTKLDRWLSESNAKFPTKYPQFEAAKRESLWQQRRTKGMRQLEEKHAAYLDADYAPNPTWWGSVPDD